MKIYYAMYEKGNGIGEMYLIDTGFGLIETEMFEDAEVNTLHEDMNDFKDTFNYHKDVTIVRVL